MQRKQYRIVFRKSIGFFPAFGEANVCILITRLRGEWSRVYVDNLYNTQIKSNLPTNLVR